MTSERTPETQPNIFRTFFGKLSLDVPKIRPQIERGDNGSVSFDIDLNHKDTPEALDQLDQALSHPRMEGFMEKILGGHSKAWYTVAFGGVSIIVASGIAGVEFGTRHGKDIQKLLDILEDHKKNKQNPS